MQSVATWLVARPHNAVLALAGTLLLPVLHLISGAIIVLLVLQRGAQLAAVVAGIAGVLLTTVAFVVGAPVAQVAFSIALTLVPSILLGALLQGTRSLALTMQVSAILAAAAMLIFQLAVDDLVAFWQPVMIEWQALAREIGLQAQADFIAAEPELAAKLLSLAAIVWRWLLYTVYLLFGYRLYQSLPIQTGNYGRFCDLNFGRVIALTMAVASVVAWASGSDLLQNVAVVLFAVFGVQGLAIVHWLHVEKHLPILAVYAIYVLMLVLQVLMVFALAVVGYMDAWFGYRNRAAKNSK